MYKKGSLIMTKLKKFGGKYKDETVERIARYFGFSAGLHFGTDKPDESRMKAAKKTLKEWTHGNGELFVIVDEKDTVGFVHINYRTGNTAWIEDIYVDEQKRGQGIATRVIGLAEDKIKFHRGYTSICLEASPDNKAALALYHKLGYITLGMITVRKEIYKNDKKNETELFGLTYKY